MKKILIAEDDRPLRHALGRLLKDAKFQVTATSNGADALKKLKKHKFDLVLLDIGLPGMNGLELLANVRNQPRRPKIIVMTGDHAPETLLRAVREQAYQYIQKPVPPKTIVELAERTLASRSEPAPIEVLSARPEWVELLVPCQLEAAERIQAFLTRLKSDMPEHVRESVGQAFRELLLNAIEWGGKFDPNRKVRIAFLRGKKLLIYRIADPGPGFKMESLEHAAISNPPDSPFEHMRVREEKGLRPGGFGLLLVRQMVDELIYNEARNEVLFVKYTE